MTKLQQIFLNSLAIFGSPYTEFHETKDGIYSNINSLFKKIKNIK